MPKGEKRIQHSYQFTLQVLGPKRTPAEILKQLKHASREATQAMRDEHPTFEAKIEPHGGFAGLGEISILLLVKAAKVAGGAAVVGAASAAGKEFYEKHLSPRLRKLNLLPRNFAILPRWLRRQKGPSK